MDVMRVGVIGFGYWGPNLARNFYELPMSRLIAIADQKEEQLNRAKIRYPGVTLTREYRDLFNMGLDAVVISTPPQTHFQIAKECLLHGLNVLVEKPLTLDSKDAEELIRIADDKDLILMVGHTFEYDSAILELKKYIENNELGDLYYFDTARLNLGLFNRNSNVIWDLAPHDISILTFLLDKEPISVSAQGVACVFPGVIDVAYLSLTFPGNVTAYVHVSWLDPRKVRRLTVVGSKKMAVYNDMDGEGRIKLFDKGVEAPDYSDGYGEFQLNYRSGDIIIPYVRYVEPLMQECQHFLDSISNHTEPKSSGRSGLRVIKILEAAQRSLNKSSTQELIPW